MDRGKKLWWKRGRYGLSPVVFLRWRNEKNRGRGAVVLAPFTGREHEVLVKNLIEALDAEVWAKRVVELRDDEIAERKLLRLLDTCMPVGMIIRELKGESGLSRKRMIGAILAAAGRVDPMMAARA